MKKFEWAIVGAGPAGVIALARLISEGINPADIIWIDPLFQGGDFSCLWGNVSGNTKVNSFIAVFDTLETYLKLKRPSHFNIDSIDPNGYCTLGDVSELLRWFSNKLFQKTHSIIGTVCSLSIKDGYWQLFTKEAIFNSKKVILAVGADSKAFSKETPDFHRAKTIALSVALNKNLLKSHCNQTDTIAVFGSSHSAIIILRYLVELGVKRIINFYRSPLRFAVFFDDWILYDNTGLKAETAQWARKFLSQNCLPCIERHYSDSSHVQRYLPECSKAIYALGFQRRKVDITGIQLDDYDTTTGIIAPGLFGFGIAFPRRVLTRTGDSEFNVGLLKFMQDLENMMPLWLHYGL